MPTSTRTTDGSIGWLHLTDLHQGLASQGQLWPNVRGRLYEDIERLHTDCGPWDIVLFTGDLTQRGQPAEFAAVSQLLESLLGLLSRLGSTPIFCAVPGNHDLRRPRPDSSDVLALGQFHSSEPLREAFFQRKSDERRRCVSKAFAAYQQWADSFPAFATAQPQPGLLPGDFSLKLGGGSRLRLGVVGLNSSFLQLHGGDCEEKLGCDPRQLVAVCGGDPDLWLGDCDAALLLTHHPPSWLHPQARRQFLAEVARPGRFLAHLYGHMHDGAARATAIGGGSPRNELQGASLFGLEHFAGRDGSELHRRHGYSAGRILLRGDQALLRAYPRVMVGKQDGSFVIDADPSATLKQGALVLTAPRLRSAELAPSAAASSSAGFRPVLSLAHADFVAAYRRRLGSWFERWDLSAVGLVQADSGAPRVVARLDDMYQPLRFVEPSTAISSGSAGIQLGVAELIAASRPLLVRGGAGAGKTTWLQHSFRTLLASPAALPMMIILRDLAQRWRTPGCRGKDRSLDAFLQDWVAQNVPGSDPQLLSEVLQSDSGPRPLLLVDGWDEVGPLGEELRSKLLGFLQAHPRVLAIVTSRPYGENPPSDSDGFRCFDIAPLTSDEVWALASRFFVHCSGEDLASRKRLEQRFAQGMERSAPARDMSHTPLLLVIMLLISRSRPLPDKRHLLYQSCLDGLLSALPDAKQEEGALLPRHQYRPDDSEERLQLVAALAAAASSDSKFVALVGSSEQLAERLPADWPTHAPAGMSRQQARLGYIRWLAGPAGLLNERTDGSLTFSHLSFQEYLTAWHLNATIEGPEARSRAFVDRHRAQAWWEPLRLWAALISGQRQARLTPVLQALLGAGGEGLGLCGEILADGLGDEALFQKWCHSLVQQLGTDWPPSVSRCMESFCASRQDDRRSALRDAVQAAMPTVHIAAWLRLARLCERSGWGTPIGRQPGHLGAAALRWLVDGRIEQPSELAAGRVLGSCHPLWPGEPLEVALFHLWPSPRRALGISLQVAVLCGAGRRDLVALLRAWLAPAPPRPTTITDRARRLAEKFAMDLGLNFADPLVPDFASDWAWQLAAGQHDFPSNVDAENLVEGRTAGYQRDWARPWGRDLYAYIDAKGEAQVVRRVHARELAQADEQSRAAAWSQDWACSPAVLSAEELATLWQLDAAPAWLKDLGRFLYHGSARFGARALAALLTDYEQPAALLAQACRLALRPDSDDSAFATALASYPASGDPIWPPLARHLAGRPTAADRPFLESALAQAERWPAPLSWGLRYLARGDVVLEDGSSVTLDQLAAEAGRPPPPLLLPPDSPPLLLNQPGRAQVRLPGDGFSGHFPTVLVHAADADEADRIHRKIDATFKHLLQGRRGKIQQRSPRQRTSQPLRRPSGG